MSEEKRAKEAVAPPDLCIAPWVHLHVNAVGSVTPCCHIFDPVGKVGERPVTEILNDEELARIGLVEVAEDPDLVVATFSLVDRQTLESLEDEDYWCFLTGVTSVDAYDLEAGTLVVDFVDPETKTRVWRGVASGAVKGSTKKMLRKIDDALRRMLRSFPE